MKKILAYRDFLYICIVLVLLFWANKKQDNVPKPKAILKDSQSKVDSISNVVQMLQKKIKSDSLMYFKYLREISQEKQERILLDDKIKAIHEKIRNNNSLVVDTDSALYKFFSGFDTKGQL